MKNRIFISVIFFAINLQAKEKNADESRPSSNSGNMAQRIAANCASPRSSKELWYNNIRTIIYTGGDMWWDLNGNNNAYYYVPAVQERKNGVSSTFAGSIWLGGLDAGGQLKVAAMTYRQNGIDFWPGPLDTTNASADADQCLKYDNIYVIERAEVDNFLAGAAASPNILNWPGNGDVSKNQGRTLAPFIDVNDDGLYDPTTGDYPAYDVNNKAEKDNLGYCKTKLYGDHTMFWVFNDNGGIHTETKGVPIGVEVRAQAFVFKTNDEINNMTFYSYEVHNRSSFQLNQTFFTIWVDADLGYYLDDYVGCDVKRGLGYIYNANPYDPTALGVNGYLDFPPSLGCDFFRGPLADPFDGIDNNFNGVIDEPGESIQMARFDYYNNNIGAFPSQTTNPDIASHYYNYMTGKWKDGSYFTVGGNGYGGTVPAQFVYDGDPVTGVGWTEKGSGNLPGDRRFLQTAGPFTLKPGAVNNITFGMPWAQSSSKGGNIQSVQLLYSADDKAQRLFDNCFKLLDGPEAPNMTIQEMNDELVFYLTNEKGKSNNYNLFNNDYLEQDISITSDPTSNNPKLKNPDTYYRFEGYIVYQVASRDVSSTDLGDRTKAIPVFQCDLVNGHSKLINYELDNTLGGYVPKVKVDGADKGITGTFRITEDAFSTSDNKKLINNKTYYFVAVAYAFNEYLKYVPDISPSQSMDGNSLGQKKPYLEGRKIKRASGVPHIIDPEKEGTVSNSFFGFGPKITRVEGQGNGGNKLTLTRASEDAIVQNNFLDKLVYENAQGPIKIKVVDPLNVLDGDFTFRFINSRFGKTTPTASLNAMLSTPITKTNSAITYTGTMAALNADMTSWELKDITHNKTYYPNEIKGVLKADTLYESIRVGGEYYLPDLGFSILIKQMPDPGEAVNKFTNISNLGNDSTYNGPLDGSFIDASITYENGTSNWLSSLQDQDGDSPYNWIHSGSNKTPGTSPYDKNEDAYYPKSGGKIQAFYDPNKQFGKILNGTWAPYPLCASYYAVNSSGSVKPSRIFCGPAFNGNAWVLDENIFKTYGVTPITTSAPDVGNCDLRKVSSVLVVLSRDKTKWSRCPVLEMQEKSALSEGNAWFFTPRKHKSVNKNGDTTVAIVSSQNIEDANYISAYGMGWFPGYAVNLETGERLNVAFGEDSYQDLNNGKDMIWNPTNNANYPYPYAFGGKHFIYVFAGNVINSKFFASQSNPLIWETNLLGKPMGAGRYDAGKRIMDVMQNYFTKEVIQDNGMNGSGLAPFTAIERDIMWVSIPMVKGSYLFKNPVDMPSEVRVQINVSKPYRYGWSGIADYTGNPQTYSGLNNLVAVANPSLLTKDVSPTPQNGNYPLYNFNTRDIATLFNQKDVAKSALDLIRVVPNPYYGSSTYETKRIENIVRITNLPNKCTIKIFTLSGTLIRTIKRDVTGQEDLFDGTGSGGDDIKRSKRLSYQEWDLKNQTNIMVASGLYIIHIDAPGIGEKVIKWFGVMRPLDVQNY